VLGARGPLYRIRGGEVEELPPVPLPNQPAAIPEPRLGLLVGGDAIIETGPEGRIFYSALGPYGIHVASTPDAGATWDRNTLVPAGRPDRQWLAFGHGHVFLTWKDELGLMMSRSGDGGQTWDLPRVVVEGDSVAAGRAVVLPGGRLCVAAHRTVDGQRNTLVACSDDLGMTFDLHEVAPPRPILTMFPMLAHDGDALWASWRDVADQVAASSRDEGRT
jgi:hypothetical protein